MNAYDIYLKKEREELFKKKYLLTPKDPVTLAYESVLAQEKERKFKTNYILN